MVQYNNTNVFLHVWSKPFKQEQAWKYSERPGCSWYYSHIIKFHQQNLHKINVFPSENLLFIYLSCLNWFILNTQPGFFFFFKKRTWKRKELLTDVETWPSPSGGPCLASPKSESFALKSESSRTLDALKSRNISCSNAWQIISTQTAEKTMQYITNHGRHLTELEGKSLELSISKDHIQIS